MARFIGSRAEQWAIPSGYLWWGMNLKTGIEKVDFHVSYNRYDSLTIRLNIHQLENGVPTHNRLTRPVLVRLGNQTGRVGFELSDQPIATEKEVLIVLEGHFRKQPFVYFISTNPPRSETR